MITEYTLLPIKNFGEIQVATMTGVIGNKFVRENKQEHFMPETIEYHSDNSKIIKRPNNNVLLQGSIKVTYEWTEEDNIQSSDIDFLESLLSQDTNSHNKATISRTDNSFIFEFTYEANNPTWSSRSLDYELDCNKVIIEALSDDVKILCIYGRHEKYNFKNVDIPAGENIVANKNGDNCYLYFSQNCTVGEKSVAEDNTLKLVSNAVTITNTSSKPCQVVMAWK